MVSLKDIQPPSIDWIPITERLPSDKGPYLVIIKGGYLFIATWEELFQSWRDTAYYSVAGGELSRYKVHQVTHWASRGRR